MMVPVGHVEVLLTFMDRYYLESLQHSAIPPVDRRMLYAGFHFPNFYRATTPPTPPAPVASTSRLSPRSDAVVGPRTPRNPPFPYDCPSEMHSVRPRPKNPSHPGGVCQVRTLWSAIP
ncbi:hypothetical protein KEM48_010357 [Puccinia striiformis f. sp. tritici PST-130]|nr:hypothetical protein KEM48_010357 [Puccinia striiformis f. sp. tritici PST-130]